MQTKETLPPASSLSTLPLGSSANFYLQKHRRNLFTKRESVTIESRRASSQSSIYSSLEQSMDKSIEKAVAAKYEMKERAMVLNNHTNIQAEGKLKCSCNICKAQNMMKTEPEEVVRDPFFVDLYPESDGKEIYSEWDFVFVLKRLIPPRHATRGLSIRIPETLVFINGEASFIVMNGKNKTLKFIKQREKLAQHEIKNFFNDCFARKDQEQKYMETTTANTREGAPNNLSTMLSTQPVTERAQGIELRKGTPCGSMSSISERITKRRSTEVTKAIKIPYVPREVALVKFNDDTTSILYDVEFENLIAKKKFDPYWKKISYIQNYRGIANHINDLQKIYFIYDREKESPLFKRAAEEAYQLIERPIRSSERFIPTYQEALFQQDLRNNNETDYCFYVLMKIYHFIERMHGVRILKMCGDFVKDSLGVIWLTNVSRLQYQMVDVKQRDENHHRKGMSLVVSETHEKMSLEALDAMHEDPDKKEAVDTLTELLQKQYENAKEKIGINVGVPNYQEDISDNTFAQLYPNAPFKLSWILKSNSKPTELKHLLGGEQALKINSSRRGNEDDKAVPVKGVYLNSLSRKLNQVIPTGYTNTAANTSSQTSRSVLTSRRMTRVRGDSSTINTSRVSKALPSLGNIESITSLSKGEGLKQPMEKKVYARSSSQPVAKKSFRFQGIAPVNISNKILPKMGNENSKDSSNPKIFKKSTSDVYVQQRRGSKLIPTDESYLTERCTPYGEQGKTSSHPSTPYVTSLRGLGKGAREKLTLHFDHGQFMRRSQSVNRKSLGYILSARQQTDM